MKKNKSKYQKVTMTVAVSSEELPAFWNALAEAWEASRDVAILWMVKPPTALPYTPRGKAKEYFDEFINDEADAEDSTQKNKT
jgi:hypothetical protein